MRLWQVEALMSMTEAEKGSSLKPTYAARSVTELKSLERKMSVLNRHAKVFGDKKEIPVMVERKQDASGTYTSIMPRESSITSIVSRSGLSNGPVERGTTKCYETHREFQLQGSRYHVFHDKS